MNGRLRNIAPELWPKDGEAAPFSCTLYVIQEADSSHFKIGIATHPIRRRSMLQCGNPRPLTLQAVYEGTRAHCREIERAAHRYFRARPLSEWVYAESAEEILRFLNSFTEGGDQ